MKHHIISENDVIIDIAVQSPRAHQAPLDLLDPLGDLDHQDRPDRPDRPEHPEHQDLQGLQGLEDLEASHRSRDLRDLRDLRDPQGQPGQAASEDPLGQLETQGHQDRQDQLAQKDREATGAQEGDKVHRDGRVHLPTWGRGLPRP